MKGTADYETNYAGLPFEDTLRRFRNNALLKILRASRSRKILEIGPGAWPVCSDYPDFERMVIVEPGAAFFHDIQRLCAHDSRIEIHNGYFEKIAQELGDEDFDMIIIGGFLHEIDNPEEVLKTVLSISGKDTRVYSLVPNSRSFHRQLAVESGLIANAVEPSALERMFQRRRVYDRNGFIELFETAGFKVLESGTYFLKPFTHEQMQQLIDQGFLTDKIQGGLDKMVRHFPEMGAEIYVVAQKN
jgi:hypothetical protein